MGRRIRIHRHGGPEVLELESFEPDRPGPGQVLLRHTAIGLNYIDVYHRTGFYPPAGGLPFTPGIEAAGVIEAVGPDVAGLQPGERVAYATSPGAYADLRIIPADRLVPLPHDISDDVAAAVLNKGITARYLVRQTFRVSAGDCVLVHAAAGGVGSMLSQWAKHLGATVIGTAGSAEKAEAAHERGCDHVILYHNEDFVGRVRELTGGNGVQAVYDGVGAATFAGSLDCLARRGTMVSYGNASGPIPPFDVGLLAKKGSLFLTRPTLFDHVVTHSDLVEAAQDIFALVEEGAIRPDIGRRLRLDRAAEAHQLLEGRETTGSTLLMP
jgi:NADPH2:quinone reductase